MTVIKCRETTCFDLFCAGRFEVPWHQRRYDWTPEHVEELLHDIDDAITAGSDCYFLGTIILVEFKPGHWRINDGQQRMVTLSLICACFRSLFAENSDSKRVDLSLRVLFDIQENSVPEPNEIDRLTPRLTPPRDDKTQYDLMIQGYKFGGNGKLTQAYKKIASFVLGMDLERSRRFFMFLMRNVEVARLDIPETVDPNSIYETINCRGKRIDDIDLIRNHLYSYFNAGFEEASRDQVHEQLETSRTLLKDDSKFSDYARCYFQTRFGHLQKKHFYRETKRHIQRDIENRPNANHGPSSFVCDLVRDFSFLDDIKIFRAIVNPNREVDLITAIVVASGHSNSARNIATFLRELSTYKVTQPLLFALLRCCVHAPTTDAMRFEARWVHKELQKITAFVMRTAFVAPKFEPSHFERDFSNLAHQIRMAANAREVDINACLRNCDSTYGIMKDEKFKADMFVAKMNDAKKTKHFLFGVNRRVQPDSDQMIDNHWTVEHILPRAKQHWEGWLKFRDVNPDDYVSRVGNLTLLGKRDNRAGTSENRDFKSKKQLFLRSSVQLTRDVGEMCDDWSPEAIEERQRGLAAAAAQVWSFGPGMK